MLLLSECVLYYECADLKHLYMSFSFPFFFYLFFALMLNYMFLLL